MLFSGMSLLLFCYILIKLLNVGRILASSSVLQADNKALGKQTGF